MSYAIHTFDSTAIAYDAIQSAWPHINSIILVPSEDVVVLPHTWPIAVTEKSGECHQMEDGITIGTILEIGAEAGWTNEWVQVAKDLAESKNWPIAPWVDLYLDATKESN